MRALPSAAGINEGDHYGGQSGAEGLACADPGARTPIGAIGIAYKHWADTQTSKSILISDEEYGQEKLEDLNHMVMTH